MTKREKNLIRNSTAEFLIFTAATRKDSIKVRYEDETIGLSQKMMAALFEVGLPNINEHLKNIYKSGELTRTATIRKFRTVQTEGNCEVSRNLFGDSGKVTAEIAKDSALPNNSSLHTRTSNFPDKPIQNPKNLPEFSPNPQNLQNPTPI